MGDGTKFNPYPVLIQGLMLFMFHFSMAETRFLPGAFQGFDAGQLFEVNSSRRFDSETESDFLTYQPISCRGKYVLQDSANYLCSSLGSLGSKRFLVDHLFLFQHAISEKLFFRVHWVKDQDYDDGVDAQAAEFIYAFSPKIGLGVHGQFDANKAADDLGISYNFLWQGVQGRLEMNAYDFSRNERNEDTDRFRQNPTTAALSLLKKEDDLAFFLHAFLEPQFLWNRPATGQVIKRKSSSLYFLTQWDHNLLTVEHTRGFLDVNTQFEDESVLRVHGQRSWSDYTAGLRAVEKRWSTPQVQLTHKDLLPFFWWNFEPWRIGYEMTWHMPSQRSEKFEHRLNTGWSVVKTPTARLEFLFTFDLDRLGSNETWEGGNGQFTLQF